MDTTPTATSRDAPVCPAAPLPRPDLSDLQTFKVFAAEFERQKLGTVQSLRWLARYRDKNGLLSSGAMVELRTPGAVRPRLLVNKPKFVCWLAAPSADVAA